MIPSRKIAKSAQEMYSIVLNWKIANLLGKQISTLAINKEMYVYGT